MRSVRLYPLSDYARHATGPRGLVFGYASLSEREIEEAVRRMSERVPDIDGRGNGAAIPQQPILKK